MGIKERGEQLNRIVIELRGELPEEAVQIGFDVLGQVKARVQFSGVGADGQGFSDYTPAYAKRGRAELGYQTAYKDFTRTGELFKSAKVELESQGNSSAIVSYGPDGTKNTLKAAGALAKGDEIFRSTDQERKLAVEAYRQRVRKKLGA